MQTTLTRAAAVLITAGIALGAPQLAHATPSAPHAVAPAAAVDARGLRIEVADAKLRINLPPSLQGKTFNAVIRTETGDLVADFGRLQHGPGGLALEMNVAELVDGVHLLQITGGARLEARFTMQDGALVEKHDPGFHIDFQAPRNSGSAKLENRGGFGSITLTGMRRGTAVHMALLDRDTGEALQMGLMWADAQGRSSARFEVPAGHRYQISLTAGPGGKDLWEHDFDY